MPPKVSKDTTHGWLVVATCSAAFFLFIGNASCLGLVEVELSSLFKDSGSSLSAINALYNGLGWGLGIGFSLMVVSSNILLSEYFDKKRPLALIISVIGGGMGIVVFPHIFTTLNQTYGIHGTFLILSALNSHGIMFSILYDVSLANSKPNAMAILRQVYRTVFDPELLRSARYTGVCAAYLLLYVAYGIPFLFLPVKNAKTGLSKEVTSLLISVSGISNLASRFIMAGLASTSGQRRRLFLSVSFAMNAVSFLFFPLFSDILFLSVGAVLFGFSAGIFVSITPPVLIDLFGVDKLSSTLGTNYLVIGTGYLLGGPLMRHLSLAMSAIDPVFYTSAGCTVMGMVLIMTVSCNGRNLARILKMPKRHFAPVSIPPVLPVNTDGGIFTISYQKY
ncbi:monocarboxylate transporter 13 isoform X2 [Magallana gigas]|uniref:monocarboxylate transporter 13 isoform X2 n=1 Tax=Magallana gigas TaxID=29159 RepID=UPI003342AD5C